jgi:hypothetical protein
MWTGVGSMFVIQLDGGPVGVSAKENILGGAL